MSPRRFSLKIALALVSLNALGGQAQAAGTTVYRCGPEGRELSDRPCPPGPSASQAVRVDQPSAKDAALARARAEQEKKWADGARAQREKAESQAPTSPGNLGPAQAARPAETPASAAAQRKPPKTKPPRFLGAASAPTARHPD